MKLTQYPRKIQNRSTGSWGRARVQYERVKVQRRKRFAFGDACGIDRKFGGPNIPRRVCFNCRKLTRYAYICPDCGQETTSVRTSMFKTPRRADKRSWKKLEEILKPNA